MDGKSRCNPELFIRTGPLMDITSYPEWTQELVGHCAPFKKSVAQHELFHQMKEGRLKSAIHKAFLMGSWPVIEQFPQYMARNLIKIRYELGVGHQMARRYLIRNIRVEQNHADQFVNWAQESGVNIKAMLTNQDALTTLALSQWCWQVCDRESLAVAMAATNYAIEGVTGEWTANVCSENTYEQMFDASRRVKAMKWLKQHARYDDEHPWEALEIIVTLVGVNPGKEAIRELRHAICKSYQFMLMLADHFMSLETKPRVKKPEVALS